MNQTPNQITYKTCLEELGVPLDIPYEALSYTEKVMKDVCRRLVNGDEIDFYELESVLDEQSAEKVGKIIMEMLWK